MDPTGARSSETGFASGQSAAPPLPRGGSPQAPASAAPPAALPLICRTLPESAAGDKIGSSWRKRNRGGMSNQIYAEHAVLYP